MEYLFLPFLRGFLIVLAMIIVFGLVYEVKRRRRGNNNTREQRENNIILNTEEGTERTETIQ